MKATAHIVRPWGKAEAMEVKNMKKSRILPGFPPQFLPPEEEIRTDPQGSYTGIPEETDEKPVQDVDDL